MVQAKGEPDRHALLVQALARHLAHAQRPQGRVGAHGQQRRHHGVHRLVTPAIALGYQHLDAHKQHNAGTETQ
jgi:hypothetical protein